MLLAWGTKISFVKMNYVPHPTIKNYAAKLRTRCGCWRKMFHIIINQGSIVNNILLCFILATIRMILSIIGELENNAACIFGQWMNEEGIMLATIDSSTLASSLGSGTTQPGINKSWHHEMTHLWTIINGMFWHLFPKNGNALPVAISSGLQQNFKVAYKTGSNLSGPVKFSLPISHSRAQESSNERQKCTIHMMSVWCS